MIAFATVPSPISPGSLRKASANALKNGSRSAGAKFAAAAMIWESC
jgi:hypothetical protein